MVTSASRSEGQSQRQLRVGELVRRKLACILSEWDFFDPELPQISVTVGEVRMSTDLKKATVFVIPLGGQHAEQVISSLNASRREIRRLLNKELDLKFSPGLHFVSDPLFDQIERTQRLLQQDKNQLHGTVQVD